MLPIRGFLRNGLLIETKALKPSDPIIPTIFEYLRKFFYVHEPHFQCIGMQDMIGDQKAFEEELFTYIQQEMSAIAVDVTDYNLLGFVVADLITRNTLKNRFSLHPDLSFLHRKFVEIEEDVYELILTKNNQIRSIQAMPAAMCHPNYWNLGVLKHLLNYQMQLAKYKGSDLITGMATNYYSWKLMKNSGFSEIWGMKFKDIKIDDKVLFPIQPPNDYLKCMVYSPANYHVRI